MSEAPYLRRTDKLMSPARLAEFLAGGYCGRLATVGADGWPYICPLLYVWLDDAIWVHNTRAPGHLRGNIDHEARVCFEIDEAGEVFPYGRFDCDTTIAYRSLVAFGTIRVVEERARKTAFFDALMAKYFPQACGRSSGVYPRLDDTTVYVIAVERMTGKETPLPAAEQRWPAQDKTLSPEVKR